MPVVVGLVLLVIAAVAYFYLCALSIVYILVPLSLVIAGVGIVAGTLTALLAAVRVLWGSTPGEVRTPADVVAGRLPGKAPDRFVRRDPAWPQYFAVQARLDLVAVGRQLVAALSKVWTVPFGKLKDIDGRALAVAWPLFIPVLTALSGYTAGVVVGAVAVLLVAVLVAAAAWAVGITVVGLLRMFDLGWQVMLRAGGTCPKCYHVSRRPAYQCPGRHRPAEQGLHRDLRPGRLGVLWRRCGCGERLPVGVLRTAFTLQAHCPLCGTALAKGAAVQTDVRIPVFGAPSAGKTHLILATLVTLLRAPGRSDRLDVTDEYSKNVVNGYMQVFDSGGDAAKTDASQQPVAVTFDVCNGRRRSTVHVFDAAGEALADRAQNERFRFLDQARTFAFVLDPFSIPSLRDRYVNVHAELFDQANPATDVPEHSYLATVSRLRDHGVDLKRHRLAFVLSKQDLLGRLLGSEVPDTGQEELRSWLIAQGLDNLTDLAERDFGEVRYFLVSARDTPETRTVTEPFRWLLTGERVQLPAVV